MALVLADRVLETTTTAGSGTITLAGAEPGYQSFSAVGDGNQTYYTIAGDTEWEVGVGTYTASGTTLSRDTVLSSSASGAKVTFSAGTKKVFVTYPSEKSVNLDVSGNISLSSAVISGVGYPSAASDAATKQYVDSLAEYGITYHTPVKYEVPNSTGNLVATYNNGTAGVSATLTNAGTLAAFVPDGVTASISDRVLVYNQTNGFENGVYTVTVVGDGSTAWVLTRATDADTYALKSPNSLGGGDAFFVTSGDTGAGETYICNNSGVINFGSTAISFVQISSAQVYKAGTGISLTNTTISLVSPVAVATGGTGTTAAPTNGQLLIGNGSGYTLSTLTAGSGVSITNSAGSITLSATGLGGTVTAVTATGPLASSGGTTPDISIANSTGTGSVVLDQGATISSATITAALSASITTLTGSSANITTVTGTTAGFSSAAITQLSGTSAGITTVSGTTTTFSSGTITQFGATSATISTVSGTNATYSNGNFTSATVTTVSGTTATYTSATVTNLNVTSVTLSNLSIASANITTLTGTNLTYTSGTVTNLNSTSANITTLTGTTFGTTATTQLRGASADITTLTGTTFGTTATTQLRGASAQITNISATSITVTNTPAFVGNGTLTMNVSGTGLSGSATFTANQSGNSTFTVTSNATSANTASAIVARDGSGNFSAGIVSVSQLNAGSTGARFDSAGDIYAIRTGGTTGVIFLGNSGTKYLFFDGTNYQMPGANLFVNGSQAVTANGGTWGISISGNAASATTINSVAQNLGYALNTTISYGGQGGPQILGQGGAAMMSFHRPGAYAVNFGLDSDNQLKVGGWSMGANAYVILTSGNYTSYVSGGTLKSQTFTSSGTFTVPTGVTGVWVTMQGGGGGGSASAPSFNNQGVPGGSSGYYVVNMPVTVTPGAGIAVTIGGGGSGQTVYNYTQIAGGAQGGTTSFGSLSMAGGFGGFQSFLYENTGGRGGRSSWATTNGTIAANPFNNTGEGAADGTSTSSANWNNSARRASGGAGGLFGAGGNAAVGGFNDVYAGSGAANSGAGGGGACSFDADGPAVSGNGGSGRVVVTWIG